MIYIYIYYLIYYIFLDHEKANFLSCKIDIYLFFFNNIFQIILYNYILSEKNDSNILGIEIIYYEIILR